MFFFWKIKTLKRVFIEKFKKNVHKRLDQLCILPCLSGMYLGALGMGSPFESEFFIVTMFENFWKCTSKIYTSFHISK